MRGLIFELKRRNVFKVAAGYALVAWILIESGSVLMPTFGVPDWFFKVYVIMVFGGFVVAMIIAWVFEITPEGVRLESEIDRGNEPPTKPGQLNLGLIALLVIALIVSITFNVTGLRDADDDVADARRQENTKVAILPFENRSVDPENAFLTDGIHDGLWSLLAEIDGLQITPRPSVKAYQDTTKSLREIGEELGVSVVVEGSVQRADDRLLVIVRVFDAATEELLFSDNFERDAAHSSVFDLQTDVSSRIVAALPITPGQIDDAPRAAPTQDPLAFAAYIEGVNQLEQREFGTLELARSNFERAIEIDPNYARAHAKLAETAMVLYSNHKAMLLDEAVAIAGPAVERSLELDPLLAEAYAIRGLMLSEQWQRTRLGEENALAAADFEKALALNPSLSKAMLWYSTLLEQENRVDEAIFILGEAMEFDARNRIPYVNMPGMLALRGRTDDAIALLLKTMTIFPDWSLPNDYLSRHLQGLGRIDEAVAWSMRLREMSDDPLAAANSLGVFRVLGQESFIDDFLAEIPRDHPVIPIGRGWERFIRGDYAAAKGILIPLRDTDYAKAGFFDDILARTLMMLGEYEEAKAWVLKANPRLSGDTSKPLDRFNANDATLLGFLELKLGNDSAAAELLDGALAAIEGTPRVGFSGYGLLDVRIHAVRGRRNQALDAFESAVDEGMVSNVFFDFFDVDEDPLLESLRGDTRFEAARERMRSNLTEMAERVDEAIETGDWEPLRERTRDASVLIARR
ncbi:MAG: hypothetical protein AAFX10_07595 [Pseudomonadota bacterium]